MSNEREHSDHVLSRIYREGAWPEPTRQIDRAILAASRRAARERHPILWRWAPSFAVAATVVLTSTLVLKAYREQPEVVEPAAVEKPAPRAKQAAPEARPAESKPELKPAPPTTTTPRGFSSNMDTAEAERLERAQRDLGFKDIPPAATSGQVPAKAAPSSKAPPAVKKEAEPARADSLERRAAAPAAPSQPAPAPISVFGAPPSAANQPAPAQAAAPAARASPKPSVPFSTNALMLQRSEPAEAPPQAQAAPPAETRAVSPGAGATLGVIAGGPSAKTAERSPQAWIEDIRKLMKEGKSEDAGAQLAEFKKRYPDYALPEDLR